jgi:hypothetical protein
VPSDKQTQTLQGIVTRFQARAMIDDGVVE